MSRNIPSSTAATWNVAGLIIAAAGIVSMFVTGVANQPAPVGAIVMLLVAGLEAFRVWRWMPVIGTVVPLLIFVGAFIWPGLVERLTHPGDIAAFGGTTVQMVGLIIAIVSGIAAVAQVSRRGVRV
jgi:hypothetical protein